MTNINDLRRKALIGKSAAARASAAIQYADQTLAKAGNKAKYKVGQIVVMTDDAIDNYGEEWRDVPMRITSVSTKYMNSKDFFAQGKPAGYHPGYDEGAGGGLYDLERVDGGKVNMSLYDWELTPAPANASKAALPAMRKASAPRTESLNWEPARSIPNGEGYSATGEQEDVGNFQADVRLLSDGTWSASFFCQIWTEAERTYDHKSAQAAADSAESMFADAVASQEDESNARSASRNTAGERRDWPTKAARPAFRKAGKPPITEAQIKEIVNLDHDNPPVIGGITVTSRAFHARYGLLVSTEDNSERRALGDVFDVPADLQGEYGYDKSKFSGAGKAARPAFRKAAFKPGDKVYHKKYGTGTVDNTSAGPRGDQIGVLFDNPVQRMMGVMPVAASALSPSRTVGGDSTKPQGHIIGRKAARPAMRKADETIAVNPHVEGSRYYVGKDGLVWYAPGGKTASNTGKSVDEFVADVKAKKYKARLSGKFA